MNLYRELVNEKSLGLNREPRLDWKDKRKYNWRGEFPYIKNDMLISKTVRVVARHLEYKGGEI